MYDYDTRHLDGREEQKEELRGIFDMLVVLHKMENVYQVEITGEAETELYSSLKKAFDAVDKIAGSPLSLITKRACRKEITKNNYVSVIVVTAKGIREEVTVWERFVY